MAIQLDFDNNRYGVSFKSTYVLIGNVSIIKTIDNGFSVRLSCFMYATKPIDDSFIPINSYDFMLKLKDIEDQEGDTFLAKCYNWLSKLPEFANSIGV